MAGKGLPSLTALLGLLAVAGYQNRDRLGDMLRGAQARGAAAGGLDAPGDGPGAAGQGGFLDEIVGMFGGDRGAGSLSEGLRSLVERFRSAGQGAAAESWVARGPNQAIAGSDLEHVLGAATVDDLAERTGLSRDAVLQRLALVLPEAVDRVTPEGRLPTAVEMRGLI